MPDKIESYRAYSNRECLYCHTGSRSYEDLHADEAEALAGNETSCMECHGTIHDVKTAVDLERWKPSVEVMLKETP